MREFNLRSINFFKLYTYDTCSGSTKDGGISFCIHASDERELQGGISILVFFIIYIRYYFNCFYRISHLHRKANCCAYWLAPHTKSSKD